MEFKKIILKIAGKKTFTIENIYHCCVQKTASQWVKDVLSDHKIIRDLDMKPLSPGKDYIVTQNNQKLLTVPFPLRKIITPLYIHYNDFILLPKPEKYRAFWVMRDPRDIIVSQYFSIKYSHSFINEGLSQCRRNLQEMGDEESFDFFIRNLYPITNPNLPYFVALQSWLNAKENDNILLCKYENLTGEYQVSEFEKILNHCCIKFNRETLIKVLSELSFHKKTGRTQGQEDNKSHYRKGIPGDWKNYFSNEHKRIFKKNAGQLLIDMDYEKDMNW